MADSLEKVESESSRKSSSSYRLKANHVKDSTDSTVADTADEGRHLSPPPSSQTSSMEGAPRRVKTGERIYKSEMMFIGQRCHWHECHREDFLPFRCADCHEHFCSLHFRSEQHQCPSSQDAYVVPLCPLCHEPPKNWKRDEDLNIAMDAHLTPDARTSRVECTAIDADGQIRSGKGVRQHQQRVKRPNECHERRCTKLMVVPIECPTCKHRFCPSHRAPNQHDCSSTMQASNKPARAQGSSTWQASRLLNSVQLSLQRNEIREEQSSSSSSLSSKPAQSSRTNPIKALGNAAANLREEQKMDKRVREERASAIKAMQARRAKGLLTCAEEVRLAEEMAKLHASDEANNTREKDCVVL